ncbi:2-oxo acid dehydrogenase subunit E2 [Candidatus Micrarchaeota archaeon]|nr:2-oxo acid dehydrogenase subunit E2 [Candidatus Micrarchaeota archaeon]
MVKEFIFPDVGEGIHEGKIVKWHAKVGDQVKADVTIVEVETDKAIVELPSPATGTVLKINHAEGETVKVGEVLVVIGSPGESISTSGPSDLSSSVARPSAAQQSPVDLAFKEPDSSVAQKQISAPFSVPREETKPPMPGSTQTGPIASAPLFASTTEISTVGIVLPGQILATPSTRKLARDLGLDISKVRGTGPAGRITAEDVRSVASGSAPSTPSAISSSSALEQTRPAMSSVSVSVSGSDQRIPLSGIRKVISDRMVYSKTHIPHACGMDFADVTSLVDFREHEKKTLEARGIKLTYLPFVVKACALALRKFPYLNSSFDEQKQEIVIRKDINIGIAVDTSEGLIVPNIKNADQKSILQIAWEIEHLASLARERKLKVEDMRNGTFTLTNIGSVGGFFSTPIINPPEVGIMGVHRIKDMALVVDGKVEPRKVLGLSLCFDHRVVDGAMATLFMNEVKQYLEDPALMLLSMV